eukprot:scaffold102874_cov60-Phaeocystis_antarctica.AAC.3
MSSVVSGSGTWYEADAARLQRCDDIVEEACSLRDVAEQRVGCSRDLVVRLHLVHLALQLGHLSGVRVRVRVRVRVGRMEIHSALVRSPSAVVAALPLL